MSLRLILSTLTLSAVLFSSHSYATIIESSDIEDDGSWSQANAAFPYLIGQSGITPTAGLVTLHINNSQIGLSQTLAYSINFSSTLATGIYQATIDIGNYDNRDFATVASIGMTAGGNLLTTTTDFTADPSSGAIETWIFNYEVTAGDAFIGQNIGFSITALNGPDANASFDNLSIDFQPVAAVPEPETYAMLLVGLGLLGFAKRKKT